MPLRMVVLQSLQILVADSVDGLGRLAFRVGIGGVPGLMESGSWSSDVQLPWWLYLLMLLQAVDL